MNISLMKMAYGLNVKAESCPMVLLPSLVSGKKEGYNRVEGLELVVIESFGLP